MGNDKSILEKIADTVKDIANIAAEAADHALKAEEPQPERMSGRLSLRRWPPTVLFPIP